MIATGRGRGQAGKTAWPRKTDIKANVCPAFNVAQISHGGSGCVPPAVPFHPSAALTVTAIGVVGRPIRRDSVRLSSNSAPFEA